MTHDRNHFPDQATAERVRRELLLSRAVEAYRTFYPAVSARSIIKDPLKYGGEINKVYIGNRHVTAKQNALTPNSDTCYGVITLDLTERPMVIESPAGNIMGVINSLYFGEVGNIGRVGPDKGKGGKYLLVGPDYDGEIPDGYFVFRSETNGVLAPTRVTNPDRDLAWEKLCEVKTYPLGESPDTWKSEFRDVATEIAVTPVTFEETMAYWEAVRDLLNDHLLERYRIDYGRLAALGIEKGKDFAPTGEQKEALLKAIPIALEQMTVEAFASPQPECLVWHDRRWEWAGVVPGTGVYTDDYWDNFASDRWFYQATLLTRLMFPRRAAPGSEYLLGVRDDQGEYLDGGSDYVLRFPARTPAELFWSVTVYDARTRSELPNETGNAAIGSLFNHLAPNVDGEIELYFGPQAPAGHEDAWIQTVPGKEWFCYFRVYGPGAALYDDTWKLGDFRKTNR